MVEKEVIVPLLLVLVEAAGLKIRVPMEREQLAAMVAMDLYQPFLVHL